MSNYLKVKKFSEIDLNDPFFDSLKSDYAGFEDWFSRKAEKEAYILEDNGVQGFLYLKRENGVVDDVNPRIIADDILKIGTMKVNPHGTRLGERFIKKAFDHAVKLNSDIIYVTVFEKHQALVNLFLKYGFKKHGEKESVNGTELVLTKEFEDQGDILLNYPLVKSGNNNKFILSIYPKYHSRMFPDSLLENEKFDLLEDKTHTNNIHKVYICKMSGVRNIRSGDIIVIYRTTDRKFQAKWRSVVTSIAVVEEVKTGSDFVDLNDYLDYTSDYSIFDESELRSYYRDFDPLYVIKMTYNIALEKRLIRKQLIEELGMNGDDYWGVLRLTDQQFKDIVKEGQADESLIID